ncbi:hypothetical protein FKW77_009972 [Venturia effusa]|uniref:Uncharacterized protein n=1 Tax=Venturia effusa TaxID=50376 RepID=A0A517L263_9PEZI|nr:hypothetical protein FKW77_009972 [Venturia effusa]
MRDSLRANFAAIIGFRLQILKALATWLLLNRTPGKARPGPPCYLSEHSSSQLTWTRYNRFMTVNEDAVEAVKGATRFLISSLDRAIRNIINPHARSKPTVPVNPPKARVSAERDCKLVRMVYDAVCESSSFKDFKTRHGAASAKLAQMIAFGGNGFSESGTQGRESFSKAHDEAGERGRPANKRLTEGNGARTSSSPPFRSWDAQWMPIKGRQPYSIVCL